MKIPYGQPVTVSPSDNRTRAERIQDFREQLEAIDRDELERLINVLDSPEIKYLEDINNLENSLIRFRDLIDQFHQLNDQDFRLLGRRAQELELEEKHDWRSKWRLLFFRVMGTTLLVVTVFLVGYIEHTYDWARLPMSSYFSPADILSGD